MTNQDATLFLATASGGTYEKEYVAGCIDAVRRFPQAMWEPEEGLYVEHNRNVLTAKFLNSGATHMLSIDTDIGWRARHVETLLAAGKDVICGTYYCKLLGQPLLVGEVTGEREGDLQRCRVVPAGFLLVTRKAVIQLQADKPDDFYAIENGELVPALWSAEFKPREACYRDDGAFSKRCRDAGVDMWLHHGVVVTHYGKVGFGPHPAVEEARPALRAV